MPIGYGLCGNHCHKELLLQEDLQPLTIEEQSQVRGLLVKW